MIISNLLKKEKELLITAVSDTIKNLKENEKELSALYKEILQEITATEPVDYPDPKVVNSFSRKTGGGFIEVFTIKYLVVKYFSEDQMKDHKKKMIKNGYDYINGEVTREEKLIDKKLVVTYTKVFE